MATSSARITLLVIYSDRVEECRTFYTDLGLRFEHEQHGRGPQHYAATLDDGSVIEIYPTGNHGTSTVRLGLGIEGASARPPLEPGRHVLTDPDGRKVDVQAA